MITQRKVKGDTIQNTDSLFSRDVVAYSRINQTSLKRREACSADFKCCFTMENVNSFAIVHLRLAFKLRLGYEVPILWANVEDKAEGMQQFAARSSRVVASVKPGSRRRKKVAGLTVSY